MATNNYQWPNEWSILKKAASIHDVDSLTAISTQVAALSNQITVLTMKKASPSIESLVIASASFTSVENGDKQVQYMNNQPYNYWGNNLPTHYHLELCNHDNFSYGNSRNVLQPLQGYDNKVAENKPSLEDILSTFIVETRCWFNKDEARLDNIEIHMGNMGATLKSLEVQLGQLTSSINAQ